jgi:hypothetical protein
MNSIKDLLNEINTLSILHPDLKDEMMDYFDLAICEIEDGGSTMHEISLALSSIQELIICKK